MTRNLGVWSALSLGAMALAVCATGVASAQEKTAKSGTRIAIVNVQEVLKSYQKFINVKDQVSEKQEQYKRTIKNKIARLEELEKKFKDPKTQQAEKDTIEREARTVKIEIENEKAEAGKTMARMEQEHLAQIFKEVDSTVREYAKANGIDLVLRYAENWDKEGYWKDASVVNRFSMPFWPMYFEPSLEITVQISEMMNRKYAAGKPAAKVKQTGFQQAGE